jgi:uncharacterized caspase-like protein
VLLDDINMASPVMQNRPTMFKIQRLIFVATLSMLGLAQPLLAQESARRVALVIGNNDYTHTTKLERAVSDAKAISSEFRRLGFEVLEHANQDRRQMNRAIGEFVDRVGAGGVGVVFFAGHGVQVGGTNFLLPIDVNVTQAEDLPDEAIDLGRVMDRLATAKARFSLLIIDACRDNPFPKVAGRSIGSPRGLSIPTAPDGLMVVYSAGVNEQALDKLGAADRDPNGLFTREFLKQLREPGVRVDEMVRRARVSISEQASKIGHRQNPAIYDQTKGDFYFVPPPAATPSAPTVQAGSLATSQSSVAAKPDEATIDLALWDAIKSSAQVRDYEEYLRQFPSGRFASIANSRRESLMLALQGRTTQNPQMVSQTPTITAVAAPTVAPPATSQASASSAPSTVVSANGGSQLPIGNEPIRGRTFFAKDHELEVELEGLDNGLSIKRFVVSSGGGQSLFRCGVFKNSISFASGMEIVTTTCSRVSGTAGPSWNRSISGVFPNLRVESLGGGTAPGVGSRLLFIETRHRTAFEAAEGKSPGLTTEQFAQSLPVR